MGSSGSFEGRGAKGMAMPPELAQWIVPLIVIFRTLSPAVIVGLMLSCTASRVRT